MINAPATERLSEMEKMAKPLGTWQAERQAELASPDSWLGVIGLFWLEAGVNRVGRGDDCPVRLPDGPALLGELRCADGRVDWWPADAEARQLRTDADGQPDLIECGDLAFFIVERDGRLAVRLRDRAWARQRPFAGLDYFPAAEAWCIEAAWEQLVPPLSVEMSNVAGDLKTVTVSQRAVFSYAGETYALLPSSISEREVFFVFRDRTSGKETYGAGRFLRAEAACNGRIVLDFNRAFNPPCAFTAFATCPLPPPENWLPFAVTAGEKKPGY